MPKLDTTNARSRNSIFLAALITLVAERYVAPRLEREEHDSPTGVTDDDQQDGGHDQHDEHDQTSSSQGTDSDAQDSSPSDALANAESLDDLALDDTERRGIRNAAIAGAVFVLAFCGAVAIPGSPLRAPDGTILTGPALLSVSIIIALLFVVVGVAYGKTVGTLSSWSDLPAWMTSGMKDLAPVLVLFFAAAQFIAWFSWSNMGTVLAVVASDTIESLGVPEVVLFLAIILMVYLLNLFITSGSAQWTLMAPVLVPAMMLLDVQPGVTQMLFRIGDSASNIITPLNVYFALMLTYLQRYRKDAGVGTLLSITLPVSVAILVGWTAFFLLWYAVGLPLGPGVPSR